MGNKDSKTTEIVHVRNAPPATIHRNSHTETGHAQVQVGRRKEHVQTMPSVRDSTVTPIGRGRLNASLSFSNQDQTIQTACAVPFTSHMKTDKTQTEERKLIQVGSIKHDPETMPKVDVPNISNVEKDQRQAERGSWRTGGITGESGIQSVQRLPGYNKPYIDETKGCIMVQRERGPTKEDASPTMHVTNKSELSELQRLGGPSSRDNRLPDVENSSKRKSTDDKIEPCFKSTIWKEATVTQNDIKIDQKVNIDQTHTDRKDSRRLEFTSRHDQIDNVNNVETTPTDGNIDSVHIETLHYSSRTPARQIRPQMQASISSNKKQKEAASAGSKIKFEDTKPDIGSFQKYKFGESTIDQELKGRIINLSDPPSVTPDEDHASTTPKQASGQQSDSTSSQTPLSGIVLLLRDNFGFIKPDQTCTGLKTENVHFPTRIAPKRISVNDRVYFVVSEKVSGKRPSAKRVWYPDLQDTSDISEERKGNMSETGTKSSTKQEHSAETHKKETIPSKSYFTGRIMRIIPSNPQLNKPAFGFMKPSTSLPQVYEQNKDVHFMVNHVQSAGLAIQAGDTLEFVLGIKNTEKPTAFKPKLVDCCARPAHVIQKYMQELHEIISVGQPGVDIHTREICDLLSCKPVWRCVANTLPPTEKSVLMFMEIIVDLEEKSSSFESNFKFLMQEIGKSSFFKPNFGKLKYLIDILKLRTFDTNVPDILKRFILVIVKHVPRMASLLVKTFKPLVSSRETSLENFLYKLLTMTLKAQGPSTEYMLWDEMPLVPGVNEILSEFSADSLLQVKPVGHYSSTEEYVEVYFRLLREDCFYALKKGVQGLLKGNLDPRDMSVFQCTKFCGLHLTEFDSALSVALKVKPLNIKKNWNARNLIFGNLVCITTTGNFSNNIWGTVMSREMLKSHDIVVIQLCSSGNLMSSAEMISLLDAAKDRAILVESPTYYKAFEPVLKSLQKLNPETIPFQEELVHVQKSQCPVHQRPSSDTTQDETFTNHLAVKKPSFECVKESDLAGLDPSQAKAIQHALRKRLAIIQGPPGTGKTFIGVRIIKLLKSLEAQIKLPILVLTYKNHALDEFLRDISKLFPGQVTRIGGRSKDETLQKCNLNEVKREHRIPQNQFQMLKTHKAEIESLKEEIQAELTDLHISQKLSISALKHNMNDCQIQNMLLGCKWSETNVPSLQQMDSDGFVAVKGKKKGQNVKIITQAEATKTIEQLDQSVASFLECEEADESDIWVHLNNMTNAAFQQWIPPKGKFEEIIGTSGVSISSINVQPKVTLNDEKNDDKDAEEEEKERIASHAEGSRKGKAIFDEMLFLPPESTSKWRPQFDLNSLKLIQDAPLLFYANITNPWDLPVRDRIIYIQTLLHENFQKRKKAFEALLVEYDEVVTAKREIEDSFKLSILSKMAVVGMTITGASIHNQLLSELRPSVVIVEEAGEVLEPQILPVIGNWTDHLILIGDHKQLRPSVDSHVLAKRYHFDISMMERLINNDLDYESLTMQNRMREEFAELLLDIYPNLQSNASRVKSNLPPLCTQESMFFWSHSDPEESERSYKNEAEAHRAIKLALFFIQQQYRPSQVTILAAYQGQVSLLRKLMTKAEADHTSLFEEYKKKSGSETEEAQQQKSSNQSEKQDEKEEEETERIQIQTIDNYQGDENDIVIVSLVRSNDRGNVGFLNTLNRRCVAQSRARCGMYFIGNRNTLISSAHWSILINKLDERRKVGKSLILKCPRHPTVTICAQKADDITLGSFCKTKCNAVMSCEIHYCKRLCQPSHSHLLCHESVDFVFPKCNHAGKRACFENQDKLLCWKKIPVYFDSCDHTGLKPCHDSNADIKCQEKCSKILQCTHMCTMKCSEPCSVDNCDMCEIIRKEKEEQERKAKEAEQQRVCDEVCTEIERIRSSEKRILRFELQPIGETASEYTDVEDKVKKYIQVGHKWFPIVKKIEKIENSDLRLKWLQCRNKMFDPTYEALKFHGTSAEAVDAIVEKGFLMPKPAKQMYGPGIYFATDSSKSAQQMYTKGSNMLLLCRVLLGKTYTVDSAKYDMTRKTLRDTGYDSLYAARDSRQSGGVLYDEYVVFDVRQALPQYVVHYTTVSIQDTAHLTKSLEENALTQNQLVKHTAKPRRAIKMDDPLDVHLRIAEAQFQRLLNSNHYKAAATQIQSLDYYINPPLLQKFRAKAQEFMTKFNNGDNAAFIYAFHGTKEANIQGIVKENFSLQKLASNTGDRGYFGAGIYFSEFPDTSLGYGKSLLLCKVLPGLSYEIDQNDLTMHGKPLKDGHNSHLVGKDSQGRGTELVIFNPDQILPCYVINL